MRALILALVALNVVIAGSDQSLAALGGQDTGGGNAIQCDDGKMYAWDYANQKLTNAIDPEIASAKTADEILGVIANRLMRYNRPMARSLNDFRKFNADPLGDSRRFWMKTTNPLINVGDEDRSQLPVSCVANAKPDFKLYQAVIRRSTGGSDGKIRYQADQKILDLLAANSPLQLSYLYIHEWLRDFAKSADDIGVVNQLLHGARLYKLSYDPFNKTLSDLGMHAPEDEWIKLVRPGKYKLAERSNTPFMTNVEIVQDSRNLRVKGQFVNSIAFKEYDYRADNVSAWGLGLKMPSSDGLVFTGNVGKSDTGEIERGSTDEVIPGVFRDSKGQMPDQKKNFQLVVEYFEGKCFILTLRVCVKVDPNSHYTLTGYSCPFEQRKYCLDKSSLP